MVFILLLTNRQNYGLSIGGIVLFYVFLSTSTYFYKILQRYIYKKNMV